MVRFQRIIDHYLGSPAPASGQYRAARVLEYELIHDPHGHDQPSTLRATADAPIHHHGPAKRRDSKFVTSYLKGLRGIEIGASAHNRYYLDESMSPRGADDTKYKREERRLALHTAKVDVIAPGDDLPFGDDSVDFVFASHVIEHIPDPIRALYEWVRVAQRYVVLIVPHRDRTFDADRPLTSAEELLTRHREGFTSEEDMDWSVWTCESFIELCDQIGLPVVDHLDPDDKVGNGFAVVIDASVKPTPREASAQAQTAHSH